MRNRAKQPFITILLYSLFFFVAISVNGKGTIFPTGSSEDSLSEKTSKLKILSWNIGMLPVMDLFNEDDDRPQAISNALRNCDYDIIVFEEAFRPGARSVIKKQLQNQYPYVYGPVNKSLISLRISSGLWILSKIPLEVMKSIEFSVSDGFDSFARKGAVLLEGEYQGSLFQLVATHLEDDEYPQDIREKQLKEIFEKLLTPFAEPDVPQIICGDFNTDEKIEKSYLGMLNILNAQDGIISGKMKFTFDDLDNDAFQSSRPDPRRIDYILTRNSQSLLRISRKVAILKSKWGGNKEYLSDHNGLEAAIEFKKTDYLTKAFK